MKAAGVYARMGWSVVPLHSAAAGVCSCSKGSACKSAGKHPRFREWQNEASSDPAVIADWKERFPGANVGVATGDMSGFFVLDVDPDKDGPATLAALIAKHGELPVTPQQLTGSGGSHYLFELPDFEVTNSAGKLGPGLDTRGDGGQIVVAPSRSAKGDYRWIVEPWNTPLAPAPDWLLELLQRKPERAPVSASKPSLDVGEFPPASAEVLAAAREALEAHGPAVEGQGGDQHTFVAACLLVHDFALTEDEAWPLFSDWNDDCEPKWSEEDLRAKLRGGGKYASRPFGCRRSLDAVEIARGLIAQWQDGARTETSMFELIAKVRHFASICGDSARHAVITRDLAAATGLTARALNLPKPTVTEDSPPGSIEVTPQLHEVADKATQAIQPHVFARNGVLCEVVKAPERTFISDLEPARILDLMSRHAKWVRHDDKGLVVQAPPAPVAQILHARRGHARVRPIEQVTTSPIFLSNGSILQQRGYNAAARVFLEPNVAVEVPEEPTREDARDAIRRFRHLLSDFKFAPGGFSAWLSGVLSCLVRSATNNAPAPLVCVSASSPGAGKSLLAKVAARIVTGQPFENRPYNPKDASEWGKRVTSYVRAGMPMGVFDNINGAFGDETLDRLITSSSWSDRVLGASEAPPIAIVTTWWATGNNIEPQGDTVRRILMVRLEVDDERPQERSNFKIKNLETYTIEHRAELLSAALTILRAYHVAGRPAQALPEWGSFETWSRLVRGALVWCGLSDPFVTQQRAAAELYEPENEAHDFWIHAIEGTDGLPATIAAQANTRNPSEVLGVREQITPYTLRKFVRRFIDKPRSGKRIRREGSRYHVERISA